jgi:rhamnogalacturonan endolyase
MHLGRFVFLLFLLPLQFLFGADAPRVVATLTPSSILVKNGLIEIEVARQDGSVHALRVFDGRQYHDLGVTADKAAYAAPSEGELNDPPIALYWDANAAPETVPVGISPDKKGYYRIRPGVGHTELLIDTPDRAEVATIAPATPLFPFAVEVHYTIFRGQSGVYAYAVLRHGAENAAATLYQTRFVVKTVMDGTFDQWAVGDGKFVPIPQAAITKKLTDATFQLADGTIKTKYMNSVYWADVPVYGYVGKRFGLWMVEPSPEYHNGGPTKQGQTVHDNVLLRVLQSVHFGASPVKVADGEEWNKVYGPFLIYANQGASPEELWKDAERQLGSQRQSWPHGWIKTPEYSRQRGSLSGRVLLNGAPATGSTAILSNTGVDWSLASKGYNYWARLQADGSFHIDKVVPGFYTLSVTGADQPYDFVRQQVRIVANEDSNLGDIHWQPASHGKTVFQIGTFDRSAGEFCNGSDTRQFGMFRRYPEQFPHDVHYVIGQSRPDRDWNYAHWTIYNERPAWSILFSAQDLHGTATLTIGIASAQPAHGQLTDLRIRVNGNQVGRIQLPKTGTAGYRGGTQDSPYHVEEISFSAALLHEGENTIELEHADALPAKQFISRDGNSDEPAVGAPGQIMYDAIRLEVKPQVELPLGSLQLIGSDDFNRGLDQWHIEAEEPSAVTVRNGALDIDAPAGLTLWWKQKLHGPLVIEYLATAVQTGGTNDRVSDLNCFWMATDPAHPEDLFAVPRHGAFAEYDTLHTYYVGLGGNGNTTTRFRRYIGRAGERPLLPENDRTTSGDLLVPNQEQTIRLIADGNTITYERNGSRLFTYHDDEPYYEGWFALRTVHSHLQIRQLRIYSLAAGIGSYYNPSIAPLQSK